MSSVFRLRGMTTDRSRSRSVPRQERRRLRCKTSDADQSTAHQHRKHEARWSDEHAENAVHLLMLNDQSPTNMVKLPQLPARVHNLIGSFLRFDSSLPNQLYVIGGRNEKQESLDDVHMFDTWHGEWVTCPRMPTKRAGCAAAPLPDKTLMVVGGYDDRGIIMGLLASCEIFNPAKQKWTLEPATLSRARWGHSCAFLGGVVYAVGGCSLQPRAPLNEAFMDTLSSCESFDCSSRLWKPCSSLCVPRAGARVVVLGDRYLAAVGGCLDVFGRAELLSSVEIFCTQIGRWTLLPTQLLHTRTTAAVAPLDDHRILVVGGLVSPQEASTVGEVFQVFKNPEESSLPTADSAVQDDASGRMGCQAIAMDLPEVSGSYPICRSRCVVVVGGETSNEESAHVKQFDSVLVYDADVREWRPRESFPPIPVPRTAMALCVGHGRIRGHA